MAADFSWGLIGPGSIANRFAEAVCNLPGTQLRSVYGRDAARAADFARLWSRDGDCRLQPVPDLDAMLADPAIDAVYIATPHSSHGGLIRRCLEAGKPVLCEKPMLPNLAAGKEIVAFAQARNLFLMEAMWSRFLPIYDHVGRWLQEGAIGKLQGMQSSFCFAATFDADSRLFNPALAGGALLDIGIYNIAMTRWVIETSDGVCREPTSIRADGLLSSTGVDQRVTATLLFPGGIASQFVCALDGHANNSFSIFGDKGMICLPENFWQATEAVLSRHGLPAVTMRAPFRINGFEGEIEEVIRCVRAGLSQSSRMPLTETLATLACIDEMRRQLGVRYPFE